MAEQEIVTLKVTTEGDREALKSLTSIDKLIKAINEKKVRIDIVTEGAGAALSDLRSIADLIQQINQTQVNISVSGLSDMENAAQKAADAASRYVENTNALVPAYTEAIKVGDQVVMCEQQILGAAQNRASAYDKAAEAAGNIIDVEYTLVEEENKATEAAEKHSKAADALARAKEKSYQEELKAARAQEKTTQEQEKTAQAQERTTQAKERTAQAEERTAQAAERTRQAQEKSYQAAQKTAQEQERSYQAHEKTIQSQNRLTLEQMRQQEREQQRLRQGYQWLGHIILRSVTRNIRKATDELKAMNAEMVSIQKVTGATDADMERLKNSAFEVAGALGSTPSDYLSSVTKWAQAGYGALSEQLGELSAKTQVVGDVNEETANKFLLAVDAAYKYKGNIDALTRVLDGANEISNNYATSVEKLAGGMGIVSSLAEQAGMKVEETMAAIGTITAKTQESGNSAARALRALILNIQGKTEIEIDAETGERWTEDEIQRTAAALGDLNVATREYKNGIMELRNPMKVIGELAEKYRDGLITEAQLQDVVASLGGKVRSNQLMALIQGYETYVSMIETYRDAVGSADNELQIYLDGWEAKSNQVVNKWTEFVESFKASDISMTALDLASALLDIANTPVWQIVALTAAMAALNAAMKTDKGAAVLGVLNAVPKEIGKIVEAANGGAEGLVGLKAALKGAQAGAGAFAKSLYSVLGPVGLLVVGITALVGIADALNVSAEEQAQKTADAVAEYEKEKATLEGLEDQLKTTQARIDELNGKGPLLTVVEREELDKLKEQNRDLEWQITLQEKLAEAKKQAAKTETNNALNKGYTGADYNYRPWRDSMTGTRPLTTDELKYDLGRLQGFENQGKYLIKMLDDLNEKKQKFLSDNGEDAGKWSEGTAEDFRKIKNEIETVEGVAIAFYDELYGHMENLPEADQGPWRNLAVALREAIDPSKALTDRLNDLVDAMDEAEKTKFNEMLARLQKDGKVTAEEVQTLIDRFPVLKVLLEGNADALGILAQHFTEATAKTQENTAAAQDNANAAEDEEDAWDKVAATLKKYADRAQDVKYAQEELKKNGELSFNTLVGLLGKYGNAVNDVVMKALNGQATQEEIFKALEIAYEHDVDNYRNAMLEKEMDNEDFYSSWLAGNAETVNDLAEQYGIDARNYKTFAGLKEAIENGTQTNLTNIEQGGANDRIRIFGDIQRAFEDTQNNMITKAQDSTGIISRLYGGLAGAFGKFSTLLGSIGSKVSSAWSGVKEFLGLTEDEKDNAWKDVVNSFSPPKISVSGSSGSKGSSSSAKDWYETQIDNLKKLEDQTKRTNQVLERSDEDTAQKRIANLKKVQEQILAAQKQFIAKGKDAASDEVNQLKIMYAELGDDIRGIWSSMSENILAEHDDLIWQFDLKANNQRTVEQIADDAAAMVESYRKMQQDVHKLANYYRSQGVRENDKLIRDLQDKWWEYEKAIRSMYDNLTDAFKDYIDESSHKIEELGRATGNVGKQIEIYAERIKRAQETIAALQSHNINGEHNGSIQDLESQIWGDKDSIRDLQEGLWDELEKAFDDIFDKAQEDVDAIGDEISAIQDQMDEINEVLERYDEELEGVLKPINDAMEKLNEQLEEERKRLEDLTRPLSDRRQELEDQINGYYTLNPDGSIGPYVEGLEDQLDRIAEGIEAVEEEIDGVDDQIGAINDQISGIDDQIGAVNDEMDQIKDAWDEQKKREEEAIALQKKQLAVEEAQKAVQDAMLALQTARNERNIYTLKDGVWAWRADEEAIAKAEKALAEAEKAKEEAEKELQDYKEEQAHKLILKRLEEQIKTLEAQKKTLDEQKKTLEQQKKNLEEQKKSLDEQKKLVDKQKELLNKQIDAINKQIDAYERESSARQELIQDLIDRNEKEKKAWEEHYAALKEQYSQQLKALEAEKKAAEERKKQAQQQYDDWMDTWKDIQKSIETPARDLSEILNDIARYGTPAMADQVDRVTELLRDLGYAIEDVTSGGGYDPDDGWNGGGNDSDLVSTQDIIAMMKANGQIWANSPQGSEERRRAHEENLKLGAIIGATYDAPSGKWNYSNVKQGYWDISGITGYSGYSSQGLTAYSLGDNDGWETTKARNGILSSQDYTAARAAGIPPYASYSTSGDTVYNDDHSLIINGMTLGSSMLSRPMSDVFRLVSLNMGT